MLRKRVIFCLLFNKGVLYRTRSFKPVNLYTHNFIDTWSVDEIVMLDISRENETTQEQENFFEIVNKLSKNCFVPISAGGRVRSIKDVENLLNLGADKVVINTQAFKNPSFITEIATKYGSQCAVVSIDVKKINGDYEVYIEDGQVATGMFLKEWVSKVEQYGAGEIYLNSLDRDGMLTGYDLELVKYVESFSSLPIIISGGAGSWQHFVDAFNLGVSAVCTTNIFHFTDTSICSAKSYLKNNGVNVR